MNNKNGIKRFLSTARPFAIRGLYLGFILSFLLPYVNVTGCSTGKVQMYYGFQLIQGYSAIFYLGAIGAVLACLVLSFIGKELSASLGAFAAAWRAICAALCGLIAGLFPGIQHLLDEVSPLAGQLLGLTCAAVLFAEGALSAIRGYIGLRRDRSPRGVVITGGALIAFHGGALVLSLVLVPCYFIGLGDEWGIALLYFLLLSLPFALAQLIAIEGVRLGEGWPRTWTWGASILATAALVLTLMLFL